MRQLILFCVALMTSFSAYSVKFQGLIEDPSVSINTFLCSPSAVGVTDCFNVGSSAVGYDVVDSQPLQLFNNQSYWLTKKAAREHHLQSVERYSGLSLESKMTEEGWAAMGAYCIFITTDSALTQLVMPLLIAKTEEVKVVVQLLYNGQGLIQLWSQDAMLIPVKKSFNIVISAAIDNKTSKLSASSDSSKEESFLEMLRLSQINRQPEYDQAISSPRSVKLQIAS